MILVFGKSGQLAQSLAAHADTTRVGRGDVDLMQVGAAQDAIERLKPSAVINAAAYTNVDQAETERDAALRLNADAPGEMAQACAAHGIPFVHVSTDYVFDGSGAAPWRPDDPVMPLNFYGHSKAEGEARVRASGATYVVLRTAWVFSGTGNSFVRTMMRLGQTKTEISVVSDQVGGPTPADDLGSACLHVAQQLGQNPDQSGTYHFAGQPDVTRAAFAREIMARSGNSCSVTETDSSEFPTPAKRPLNSRLDGSTFTRTFDISMPDWRPGLDRAIAQMTKDEATL